MDKKQFDPNDRETGSKKHGGDLVEAISVDELEPMNEPDCKHEMMQRDFTETDYLAFVCANEKCGLVKLFDKV